MNTNKIDKLHIVQDLQLLPGDLYDPYCTWYDKGDQFDIGFLADIIFPSKLTKTNKKPSDTTRTKKGEENLDFVEPYTFKNRTT